MSRVMSAWLDQPPRLGWPQPEPLVIRLEMSTQTQYLGIGNVHEMECVRFTEIPDASGAIILSSWLTPKIGSN